MGITLPLSRLVTELHKYLDEAQAVPKDETTGDRSALYLGAISDVEGVGSLAARAYYMACGTRRGFPGV